MVKNIFTKVFAISLILFLKIVEINAQGTIRYTYDANGNRTSRALETLKSGHIDFPITEKDIKKQDDQSEFESSVKLYPNPTTGIIKLQIEKVPDQIVGEYRVYNLNGTVLKHSKLESAFTEIFVGDLPDGIYVMRIILNIESYDFKVIKHN